MNALPLPRRITQLGYPPVDGFRHAAQLVGVGLAFLAKAPVREPLVESLGFDELLVPSAEKGVEVVRGIHPAELPKH